MDVSQCVPKVIELILADSHHSIDTVFVSEKMFKCVLKNGEVVEFTQHPEPSLTE
jgi:hypothetical protein